jgi:LSD1 subclass zinc finger protein
MWYLILCGINAPSVGRHLLLPPLPCPRRFIWQTKAELRAGNLIQKLIQSIQILYKPLYRQNNHYSGKSTTSRLTYQLVSKSVPCRLDSTCQVVEVVGSTVEKIEKKCHIIIEILTIVCPFRSSITFFSLVIFDTSSYGLFINPFAVLVFTVLLLRWPLWYLLKYSVSFLALEQHSIVSLVFCMQCFIHQNDMILKNEQYACAGMEMARLICGGCQTLLMYTRNATTVRCSCCDTVNLVRQGT